MLRPSKPKARFISSLKPSLSTRLAFLALGLAFFIPGITAPGHAIAGQEQCPAFDLGDAEAALQSVAVVLVADITGVTGTAVTLAPVVYLKGATSGATILLTSREDGCEQASFEKGTRVLAALPSSNGQLVWPAPDQVFAIDESDELGEHPLVLQIRDVTAQFAFPADSAESAAGIAWRNVVLPLGIALSIIGAISFVMMIYWHRIDPS